MQFIKISQAYEVLGDPKKKEAFDEHGIGERSRPVNRMRCGHGAPAFGRDVSWRRCRRAMILHCRTAALWTQMTRTSRATMAASKAASAASLSASVASLYSP